MIFIHKICIAFSGLGSFRNVDIVIKEIAAMLLQKDTHKNSQADSKYVTEQKKSQNRFSDFLFIFYFENVTTVNSANIILSRKDSK